MNKQIHHHLMDYYKEVIPRVQEESFERRRQSDKVIIWLTAISTASIALLISKSESIAISNPYYLKMTVAFLLLSVIGGAIYRAFLYPLEQLQSEFYLSFESYCYGASIDAESPRELHETDTKENIASYLKNDMGLDYDHWLEHEHLDREFWVEHYNSWANFWNQSVKRGRYPFNINE